MKAILAAIFMLGCASASPPEARYTAFEDPVEHAFTVDVPQGWSVKGGIFRIGYSDPRAMVEMKSPDGKMTIRLGDFGIPPYSVPDRSHPQEGVVVELEPQAQIGIARYRSGPEFAVRYGNARFSNTCDKAELAPHDSLPVKFNLPPGDPPVQQSEGEAFYKCTKGSVAMTGFVYTKTSLGPVGQGGVQMWSVNALMSFLANDDRAKDAAAIAVHAAESLRIKPQWIEYQKKMDAEGLQMARLIAQKKMQGLAAQVQQFRARMKAMSDQVAGFEARQNRQAAQVQGFSDALNGITRTHDPLTGQYREVWSGQSNQYWVNGAGQVVSSANSPGPSFHQLQTVR